MKQKFSNMEVVISSDRPMFEGSMAAGTGILRLLKKQFIFDARTPKACKKNPRLFHGKWFSARWSDHFNRFRITCLLTKDEVIYLQKASHEREISKEIVSVLKKLLTYAS